MSRRKIIPYNPELKNLARELRRNMTFSEVLLWNELKNKGMLGYDFDRQRPIGNYIVDFFCKDLSLAIEIDGDTHLYRDEYDELRQVELEKMGVKFLRFDDIEVKRSMNNVLRVIADWIERSVKPTLGHSRENAKENDLYSTNIPTPDPSEEGNEKGNDSCSANTPTPDPSREGNPKEAT